MTINRTTLLDLPLPVTGTESGTWGDTTNNGLTQYMDIAIAGMSNLTSANFTAGAVTIETTEGTSSATNIVATSAQYAGFRVTSLAQNSTITVGNTGTSPARSYRLINADATYSLTFKATGQTGVTLLPGQSAVVAFNGTDYVIVGMVGAGTATDNAVVRFDGTTGKLVQNSVVTIADSTGDVAGVGALTMGGNLTLSGGTANGVLYLNGSKVATSGSALTFDGTNFATTGTASATKFIPTGGTATGNGMYLPTSNELAWSNNGSETMRLTSTGLGIGTSSPGSQLQVNSTGNTSVTISAGSTGLSRLVFQGQVANNRGFIDYDNTSSVRSMIFRTNEAEVMRLDSSGNLGLGVTPSAWYLPASWRALQVGNVGIFANLTTSDARYIANGYLDSSGTYRYINSAGASWYGQNSGAHAWLTAPSGTAGNAITFTQAMTLDASGNLGIGTTSPTTPLSIQKNGDAVTITNNASGAARNRLIFGCDTSTTYLYADSQNGATANPMVFWTGGSERARITSGGEVYIAGTTDQGAYNLQVNGTGVWGAGAYVNGSDERLKDNIQTLNDGLAVVSQLRPVTFQYKPEHSKDQSVQPGFIAQELQQAMDGKAYLDGVVQSGPEYLNVAYQNLIPILTKAIQEQQALITSLTARVALLEGN